ncbi:MAG: flagellar hook-associated protein FlgL [Vulcanimicrobiaceae bacterium]
MRIATSTIYEQQTAAIDNLVAQQAQYGNELSTGKSLNVPSDNPTQIAQDLAVRNDIALGNNTVSDVTNLSDQLTTVDGAMSTLTKVLQSARSLAVQGASDAVNPSQQQAIADQLNQLLGEAIGVANTQYAGQYVFAGSASPTSAPVQANGSPASAVSFSGNNVSQSQVFANGQRVAANVTLQQAFNYQSTNGTPDVFQTLIDLRNTLQNQQVVDQSGASVNTQGTSLSPTAPGTPLNTAGVLRTPLTPDASGNVSISIGSSKATNGVTITFSPSASIQTVLTDINAQTGATGVTASFDFAQQKLSLSSSVGAFSVQDTPSPGATNTGNFVEAFGLQRQADVTNTVSTQIGNLDNVLQVALNARATLGSTIQRLQTLSTTTNAQVVSDTQVQSGIEDANIPQVVSKFSLTQTALQAAYGTTTRLEQKTLFDYLT